MSGKSGYVLVVEDTLTQALILQHLLESHDFDVFVARSAAKSIEYIEQNKPDIILSDVNMPEMNGYELCKIFKSDPKTSSIPFVLLSSFQQPQEIVNLIECGADNFLLKRFDADYLVVRIKDILATDSQRKSGVSGSGSKATIYGAEQTFTSAPTQALDMLISAFSTVTHVIPLLREE